MLRPDLIADAAADALREGQLALREEQAVRGLDALDEVNLHRILQAGFESAGFGVLAEQPYPALKAELDDDLPQRRDRLRCDLVLADRPLGSIHDAVGTERVRRELLAAGEGTLFEEQAVAKAATHEPGQDSDARAPHDVFWLEIKTIGQFTFTSGVPGPNSVYASNLTRGPVQDLVKLSADPHIAQAGVMVILFSFDCQVAQHDLGALAHKCLDRDLELQSPVMRQFEIDDRIGNGACTVWLAPLRSTGLDGFD